MKTMIKIVVFKLLPPIVLWIAFGNGLLNRLLSWGVSYNLYLVLGNWGGLIAFFILWYLFLLVWKNIDTPIEEKEGCGAIIVIIAMIAAFIWVANPFGNQTVVLLDRMFPLRLSVNPDVVDTAFQVCNGLPMDDAAIYPGDSKLHPVVLISESRGWHEWTTGLPKTWRPNSKENVQLVACTGEIKKSTIEVCHYTGAATYVRIMQSINIRLVAAKTGSLVESIHVEGNIPADCPGSIKSSGSTTGDLNVTHITNALTPYVKP